MKTKEEIEKETKELRKFEKQLKKYKKMDEKVLIKVKQHKSFHQIEVDCLDKGVYRAMKVLGLGEEYKELKKLKKDARKRFSDIVFKAHPDTGRGWKMDGEVIRAAKNAKNLISKLTTLPMTLENMDAVLNIRYAVKYEDMLPKNRMMSYDTVMDEVRT